jgi:hypothetical protein
MIDVMVLGCGLIRTGEGAAAPFIGVHILGEIRPAGGFVSVHRYNYVVTSLSLCSLVDESGDHKVKSTK